MAVSRITISMNARRSGSHLLSTRHASIISAVFDLIAYCILKEFRTEAFIFYVLELGEK